MEAEWHFYDPVLEVTWCDICYTHLVKSFTKVLPDSLKWLLHQSLVTMSQSPASDPTASEIHFFPS